MIFSNFCDWFFLVYQSSTFVIDICSIFCHVIDLFMIDFFRKCLWLIFMIDFFQKQTKNRNETDSNLSLGTRLTRVKRLSRASVVVTQHRTAAWNVIVSLFWLRIVKTNATSSSNIEGFGGIPGPEAYQIKNEYAQRRRLRRINSLAKVKFSRIERF